MKYYFQVEFLDGTTFKQNKNDVSARDPKRSAFFDLLHSKKKIKKFTLSRYFHRYSVDLQTGEFDLDGTIFTVESEVSVPFIPGHLPELTLIFDRLHKQKVDMTFQLKTKRLLTARPQLDEVTYVIGWECVIRGKTYKRVIGIK